MSNVISTLIYVAECKMGERKRDSYKKKLTFSSKSSLKVKKKRKTEENLVPIFKTDICF